MGFWGFSRRLLVCVFFSFSLIDASLGRTDSALEGESQVDRAEQAARYTVKIRTETANIFQPVVQGCSGTGFIVDVKDDKVILFTNAHVIEKFALDARRVRVDFPVASGRPKVVEAKVVLTSPLLDFAVLECPLSAFKETKHYWTTATLPKNAEAFRHLSAKGRRVMAFGNPLDSNQVASFGEISAKQTEREGGSYIQTTAPINPGNSGGPLIDVETGVILGMNTAKREDADNTGFAIPIDELTRTYQSWRKDPRTALQRVAIAQFGFWSVEDLESEGVLDKVEAEVPGFSRKYESALMVTDAEPDTQLETGDILLHVGQKPIGDNRVMLDRLLAKSGKQVAMKVLRRGQVVNVEVPLKAVGISRLRRQVDFVYLEGLVLQETEPQKAWGLDGGERHVVVTQILDYTAGQALGISRGSFIHRIELDGNAYPIRRLRDLKRALSARRPDAAVRIYYRQPVEVLEGDTAYPIIDEDLGAILHPRLSVALLSVHDVFTPREFDLRAAKAGFDFTQRAPATRNWRNWIGKGRECRDKLVLKP